MRQKSGPEKQPAEDAIRDIRRATRRHFSAEEKIRVVLEGLRGEESIAELCRREGIASSIYYGWSKEFLEAGKRRLAGDTARAATSDEVKDLRREAQALKEVVADLTPAASCCRPFATPAIWIIGWSSSAIAAPTQMQSYIRCCSTSSSRSRQLSSPQRSSLAPCLAGLHEKMRQAKQQPRSPRIGQAASRPQRRPSARQTGSRANLWPASSLRLSCR